MKKQISIVTAATLIAAVAMLNGTSVATAQQPQYQVGGFPYHPAPDVGVAALRQNERTAAPE
jgi:hypothetical protein